MALRTIHRASPFGSRARRSGVVGIITCALVLVGCGGSGSSTSARTAPTDSVGSSAGSGDSTTAPERRAVPGTVRLVNLFASEGKGIAVDVYDDSQVSDHPEPIVKDLAFHQVSKPIHATIAKGASNDAAMLYAVPAGTKPTTFSDFHGISQTGDIGEGDAVIVLARDNSDPDAKVSDPFQLLKAQPFFFTDLENGHGGPAVVPPSGKGAIVVEPYAFMDITTTDGSPASATYFVDGTCATDVMNDSGKTVTSVQSHGNNGFVVAPGEHTVGMFVTGGPTQPCSAMTPMVSTKVTVASDKIAFVFPYGTAEEPKLIAVASD